MSEISLVIPVYRGWEHATALLRHLLADAVTDLDIVVVDDASDDGGVAELAAAFPQARVVERERNGGFAAAVNTGVEASSGKTIIVSNSDLLIDAKTLERLSDIVRLKPASIIGPRTRWPSGREIPIAHRFPTPWRDSRELLLPFRLWRRLRPVRRAATGPTEVVDCDWVVGSCMAFSRRAWEQAGPLDESFGMYSEEVDWQRRASRRGVTSAYCPGAEVIHDETHGVERSSESATRRFTQIWSSRLKYHARYGGHRAALELRALWICACVINGPLLALGCALPGPVRTTARAEFSRSYLLARAAIKGHL